MGGGDVIREGWRVLSARSVVGSTRGAEATLSRINRMACALLDVPVSQLSIIEHDRQVVIAGHGLDPSLTSVPVPLSSSVCQSVVAAGDAVVVDDSHADVGVLGAATACAMGVRAYAGAPVHDAAGRVLGAFCALDADRPRRWSTRDLQLLRECAALAEDALQLIARSDAADGEDRLTGLLTRPVFDSLLRRRAEVAAPAVVAVGVNRLRLFNEAHGHAAGDRLLVAVADRLRHSVGPDDLVCRHDGDVFLVALADADEATVAFEALRLRARLSRVAYELGEDPVRMTVEVGIAGPCPETDPAKVAASALDALRAGKVDEDGRRRSSSPFLARRAKRRLAMTDALAGAARRGEMFLHYQPIVDLRTGRIVGAEALARWDHPELGRVPPGDFIPVAERTSAIVELGSWVIERACAAGARWRALPDARDFVVNVNVAPQQLGVATFADDVLARLEAHGLPGRALALEITERTLLLDGDVERSALARLHAHGIAIVLDDFGTGYSALSLLTQVPTDVLKLDRSFVADLDGAQARSVLSGILGLADGLGIRTVAEGIETPEQRHTLSKSTCDFGQGFHFARPMPPEELTRLLSPSAPRAAA